MTVFDWCVHGLHDQCARSYEPFTIDPKKNTVVWSGDTVSCGCKKRGCPCYVKPADRPKPKRKPRKRKS